ncbi:hypothetical protein [Vibrio superstes]|uniref:Uncharacterized protein n=1 Tax=Vibrio superstes NBRC 103154 TaxID=1219062 RepID=A0A511QVS5_9VIBR|nr:hypothetical protein [Vibrio superstes]GEM81474.1 hypothetical protein VSU01S_37190 [Vibrio superstes NBRC 103154]
MKTLSTLLITSLFVAPVALAKESNTSPLLNPYNFYSCSDHEEEDSGYTWEDPSEKTGGCFVLVNPTDKLTTGYQWEDPSERSGGGGYDWDDPSERSGGGGFV